MLEKRIIEISKKYHLSHLGSCLTALPIIEKIYKIKKPDEKFVLSCGHAHLAHLVVMESNGLVDAEKALEHGIHCDRLSGCDVSTGSLGQGLPIALGMALVNKKKNIYCLISDGECAEGSIWEALLIKEKFKVNNLKVYLNFNGYSAYDTTDKRLADKLKPFDVKVCYTDYSKYPFLSGIDAHYKVL